MCKDIDKCINEPTRLFLKIGIVLVLIWIYGSVKGRLEEKELKRIELLPFNYEGEWVRLESR